LGTLFVAVAAVVSRLLLRLQEAAAAIESCPRWWLLDVWVC